MWENEADQQVALLGEGANAHVIFGRYYQNYSIGVVLFCIPTSNVSVSLYSCH
jgi:hypothetical protein